MAYPTNGSIAYDTLSGSGDAIAIVGMATRFPQEANSNDNLWKFLLQARSSMTPIPSDRVNHEAHYHPDADHGGTYHVKGGHFMTGDMADFDSQFFSITKSEAMTMDPQQRIIMENVYHALENAGIPISDAMSSMTSVFTSGFNHDYLQLLNHDPQGLAKYKPTGVGAAIMANRISWFYDFKASSVVVDTACSGSMVAFHLGCQNLKNGDSEMAVVTGVNLIAWPTDYMAMSYYGFLSPDGESYSFDHRANGYSRGEGVGTVILKRLSDAIRDGNTIRAVIRASGTNQDGRTPGITLPNGEAQTALIRDVYARAGLNPEETLVVEAHGTGTAAGDPIEARAIAQAFKTATRKDSMYIGAMKSQVGHLEGAAGIASVIKSVMVLESGIIPPNANFEKPNPKIPVGDWKLRFPTQRTAWPAPGRRRISMNGMGFGGTNAHVVLDDAYSYLKSRGLKGIHRTATSVPSGQDIRRMASRVDFQTGDSSTSAAVLNGHTNGDQGIRGNGTVVVNNEPKPLLFVLSAFDENGVSRNAEALSEHLKNLPSMTVDEETKYLADLAHTLGNYRSHFPWRSFCTASRLDELVDFLDNGVSTTRIGKSLSLGFVFTGQGAQWYAMGRELMSYPVFRRSLEAANRFLNELGSTWSLLEELGRDKASSKISEPAIAHVACAALQIATVDLLASWGILPVRVVGHSSGEIAAAYCAGKLGRQAAWKVAYYRGIVSSIRHPANGAMMAVGLSDKDLAPYMEKIHQEIPGELIIACYNSPTNNTVSGDEPKIDALKALLDANSVFARKLAVSNAYHSSHMKAVADVYLRLLGDLKSTDKLSHSRVIHMFSSVTGQPVTEDEAESANYWVDNLISPVKFTTGLIATCFQSVTKGQKRVRMNDTAENVFLNDIVEIGPHGALKSAVKQTISAHHIVSSIGYLSVLDRNISASTTSLTVAGTLDCAGYPIVLRGANEPSRNFHPQMLLGLPPYIFDHSTRNWYETRITKNYRLREYPIHDLFGAPVPDWNAEEPRWRHVIRLSENPWIKEHAVTGNYTYPGVGYMVMAIEAAKQNSDPNVPISGYRLREVSFKAALNVPDTKDGVEVMIHMSRMDESSMERSNIWWNFRIMSFNPTEDDWTEHCTGYITLESATENNPIEQGRETAEDLRMSQEALKEASAVCQFPWDMAQTYDNISEVGNVYGPLFRNLSDAKVAQGRGEATGNLTVPDVASSMPKNFIRPHVIHPCTFDSVLHILFVSILDRVETDVLSTAVMPTFVKETWVSSAINASPGHVYRGHGKSTLAGALKHEADITVWDGEIDEARLLIKGLQAKAISNTDLAGSRTSKLCHTLEWKPDVDLLKTGEIPGVVLSTPEQIEHRRREIEDLQLATMLMIMDALDELKDIPAESYEGHFRNYYDWLLRQADILNSDSMVNLPLAKWKKYKNDKSFKEQFYRDLASRGPEGELCVRAGTNIAKVLKKEVDPLYLMFGADDLMEKVYSMSIDAGSIGQLTRAVLDLIGHSRTDLNVLEIGAGTGSVTAALLETLNPLPADENSTSRGGRIASYAFTDISAGFSEKAKERFKQWRNVLNFQTFNIELDPQEQDFSEGEYDIIVAGNVIHATADLRKTLGHVQRLLKPGGRLILQEGNRSDFVFYPVSFGMLEGWWLSVEPIRKWCAFINEDEWANVLRDSGFSGVDIALRDFPDRNVSTTSVLIASAMDDENYKNSISQELLILTSGTAQEGLASSLKCKLVEKYGISNCSIANYNDLIHRKLDNTLCISLAELDRPVIANPTEEEYDNARHLLCTCEGLLWVTGDFGSDPNFNVIAGLMRSVRWERDLESPNLLTLAIGNPRPSQDAVLRTILDIFEHQYAKSTEAKSNAEYILRNGIIFTNRVVDATDMNDYLTAKVSDPRPQMRRLGEAEAERGLRLTTGAPGMLNQLRFETDPVWPRPLGEAEVEFKVKAVGLNFRDIMIAMGEHDSVTFGNEAAGVVTRFGSAVKGLSVGDRVVCMDGNAERGAFQTFGRVGQDCVVKLPENMSFEVAASLPTIYSTVLYGLYEYGRLKKGETVLIHSAAGGVGQAAIMLANLAGAEVFATVSTTEKAELLMNRYGVKKDHIFSSRDLSFAKGVMRMTGGQGVDVILNSLAGEFLRRTWDCIAPFGRFIEIGKKDALHGGGVSLRPLLRNVTMASVEIPTLIRHRPREVRHFMDETMRLYSEGKIKEAWPLNINNYSHLEESFRTLQSGKHIGKSVLVPNDNDVVPVVPQPQVPPRFKTDASYVLSGGLGGIGRSIALWMASRGAKNIIFVSRSGAASPAAQETTRELERRGVKVRVFACDVTEKARLEKIIAECKSSLPPIKGCVQGAMVIADKIFENMSHEKFRTATGPKIQGSWNLHSCLPRDMDFFVLLSSVVGLVGNRGQANYSAGNTYQDALAAYRVSLDLPGTSLNIGTLLTVGYFADNRALLLTTGQTVASLLNFVREEEIHSMIEYHLDPKGNPGKPTQIASALSTAEEYMSRGMPSPSWLYSPLFTQLNATSSANASALGGGDSDFEMGVAASLGSATSLPDAIALVSDAIRTKISKLLSISLENIDPSKSVSSNGVDSLVAVEFRVWLAKVMGADIPLLDIMGTMPIEGATGLSGKVANISNHVPISLKYAENSGGEPKEE